MDRRGVEPLIGECEFRRVPNNPAHIVLFYINFGLINCRWVENPPPTKKMYNICMVKQISKVEDVGNEREQAWFMAAVNVFFNGDVEAAIKSYNETQIKYDELEKRSNSIQTPESKTSLVYLKATR